MLRTMPSWVLNISRKRDPTTSLGIPVPGLGHFHNKELINFYYFKLVFFLTFKQIFLYSNLCLFPLVLSLGTTDKNTALSFFFSPLIIFFCY